MPQPFLGSSLQSLPLAKIAHPSRGGLLPCSYPPARGSAPLDSLSPLVSSDSHAFTRLPASSNDYGLPFQLTEISLPGCPGRLATGSPRLASFVCFEAYCSLRESVHRANWVAPPRRAVALLGFFPSNAFSAHASEPPTRPGLEGPNTLLRPKAPAHDSTDLSAPRAGCDPTKLQPKSQQPDRVGSFQPPSGLTRTTLRWCLLLP